MVSYVRGRGARTLTDSEIIAQYLAGDDAATIGARANCPGETVLYLVRRAGHQPRPRGPRQRAKELPLTDAEITRLYMVDGLSGPAIADRCGATPATVYKILEANAVPRRPPGDVSKATAAAAKAARRRKPHP